MTSHPYRTPPPAKDTTSAILPLRGWARVRHEFQRCDWKPVLLDLRPRIDYCQRIAAVDEPCPGASPLTRFRFFSSGDFNDGTGVQCQKCGVIWRFQHWGLANFHRLSKLTHPMLDQIHRNLRERCHVCQRPSYECTHWQNLHNIFEGVPIIPGETIIDAGWTTRQGWAPRTFP